MNTTQHPAATTVVVQSVKTGRCWMENADRAWAKAQGATAVDESARWDTLDEALAAQETIEAARAAYDAARSAVAPRKGSQRYYLQQAARPAARCTHGDYDCNGRCYSCGRVVVRGVGSYL